MTPTVENGNEADDKPKNSIFLVGAGGIGCELLKNLVMARHYRDIHVIDLDTIEVSNLNRQFLFRREHVGQSKALVARQVALKLAAGSDNCLQSIQAYHDTIFNYNVTFIERFALVINALDNKKARSHVNRLCLAADVPLIETGSAGWSGQAYLIRKGLTECYGCQPKERERVFPGCTIRNTPSEPIHCIVWAKHLFNQLFGEPDPDQDVSPNADDPELNEANGTEKGTLFLRTNDPRYI